MNKKIIWGIVIVIAVVIFGVFALKTVALVTCYNDQPAKNCYSDKFPFFTKKISNPFETTSTSDWKTYTSEKYGITFNYPSTLFLDDSDDYAKGWFYITQEAGVPETGPGDVCGTSKDYIELVATNDYKYGETSDYTDAYIAAMEYNYTSTGGKKVSDKIINGQRNVVFDGSRNEGPLQIMIQGNNRIDVHYNKCAGGFVPFNEIVSTLKFTSLMSSTTQAFITVLSPNGGENWNKGERKIIEYHIDGAVPVQGSKVVLYLDGKDEIGSVNSSVSNSFTWTVGCYAGGDACSIKTGQHKIQARLYNGQQLLAQDESDNYFSASLQYSQPITKVTSTQSSITVLSPNGGETWKLTSVQNIRWDSLSGIGSEVAIFLRPHPFSSSNRAYLITKKVTNTGSYSWKVLDTESAPGVPATTIPSGIYTLSICVLNTSLCDISDNYFTITN